MGSRHSSERRSDPESGPVLHSGTTSVKKSDPGPFPVLDSGSISTLFDSGWTSAKKSDETSDLDPPPPYSKPTSYLGNSSSDINIAPLRRRRRPCPYRKMRTPLNQLQRYLIEILTYSINADFEAVRRALGDDDDDDADTTNSPGGVASILDEDEEKELFRLATIILQLHKNHVANN
jgi:hypothetical protein